MTEPRDFYRGDTWGEAAYWAGADDLECAELDEAQAETPVPEPPTRLGEKRRRQPRVRRIRRDAS
jgi:hypothetical protein